VIADPIRLNILRTLSETSEATAAELAIRGAASSQTLRRHLEVLVTLGVIREHPPRAVGDRPGRPATRFSLPREIRDSVRSLFGTPQQAGRAAIRAGAPASNAL
jgi:predicted ArsR family transcriptional regulator